MAKQLKLRRGTTSQHSSFTGAEGEVTVDTTKDTLVVHDGSTAGGTPLAKESDIPSGYTHPNHSGEVTSTGDGATVIADNIVDEANLKVSNSPTNGYYLQAQSGNTGGMTWAAVSAGVTSDSEYNTVGGTNAGEDLDGTNAHNNTLLGYNAGKDITNTDDNTIFGYEAGKATTGNYNTILGSRAGESLQNVDYNTLIGYKAGLLGGACANNVMIGKEAGFTASQSGSRSGSGNVVIGSQGMRNIQEASSNIAIGMRAADNIKNGNQNYCIGEYAGDHANNANKCIFIGRKAGDWCENSNYNIGIGDEANIYSTGDDNIGIGRRAIYIQTTTGADNIGIGQLAGQNISSGSYSVAIGKGALGTAIVTGDYNVALGFEAGKDLTSGANNICIGKGAAATSATTSNEITLGDSAITKFRIPGINFALKDHGSTPSTGQVLTADSNGEGYWAAAGGGTSLDSDQNLYSSISGNSGGGYQNISLGNNSGASLASGGNYNTFIGRECGRYMTTGDYNIALGYESLKWSGTSSYNVALGFECLTNVSSGAQNIGIGKSALRYGTVTGADNVAIGNNALYSLTSGAENVAIGNVAGQFLTTATNNTMVGRYAGNDVTSGDSNSMFGASSGSEITTGEKNSCLGGQAGLKISSGNNNTCVGYNAGYNGTTDLTTGSNNTIIGYGATPSSATVSNEITIGNSSITKFRIPGANINFVLKAYQSPTDGKVLTADANGEAGWETPNESKFYYNASKSSIYSPGFGTSYSSVTSGYQSGGGYDNFVMGRLAGNSLTSGGKNVLIGNQAGQNHITDAEYNTAVGLYSIQNLSGDENTALGYQALTGPHNSGNGSTGYGNTAVGYNAGYANSTGYNNTYIGRTAGSTVNTGNNNICIGYQSGGASSQSGNIGYNSSTICLGNNSIGNFYCADTSISSSDKRDKTDITDFTHGLKWVEQLKPITYRWDKRVWYNEYNEDGTIKTEVTPDGSKKTARQHIGFLAQDVLAIEQADGFASKKDDMLVVNLNEDDTAYGLKYERLVPVLVNAIKELSAKVKALEAK